MQEESCNLVDVSVVLERENALERGNALENTLERENALEPKSVDAVRNKL